MFYRSPKRDEAWRLFLEGRSLDDVVKALDCSYTLARSFRRGLKTRLKAFGSDSIDITGHPIDRGAVERRTKAAIEGFLDARRKILEIDPSGKLLHGLMRDSAAPNTRSVAAVRREVVATDAHSTISMTATERKTRWNNRATPPDKRARIVQLRTDNPELSFEDIGMRMEMSALTVRNIIQETEECSKQSRAEQSKAE